MSEGGGSEDLVAGVCSTNISPTDLQYGAGLLNEATFYDKQWDATWEGADRPSEKEK